MGLTNPEAWARAVDILLSWKRAAKLLVGALLFLGIIVAGGATELSSQLQGQVPIAVLVVLLAVICFALGVLIFDGLAWVVRAVARQWRTHREMEIQKQQREARRDRIRRSVPYLLPDIAPTYQKLLSDLGGGSLKLSWTGAIHDLVHMGLIELEMQLVDRESGLFRLHPDAKDAVQNWLVEQRKNEISRRLRKLSAAEGEFLALFLQPPPNDPAARDHPYLAANVYEGAEALRRAGILVREPVEGGLNPESCMRGAAAAERVG